MTDPGVRLRRVLCVADQAGIGPVEQLPRELRAALDAQRPEEACPMRLDGVDAHEQRVGDLLVRPTGGYEVDDLPLRRRERSALGSLGGDPLEFGLCTLQPQPRTQPLEDRDASVERALPAISGGRGAGSYSPAVNNARPW